MLHRRQYLTNAFDNSSASRANQDVGLDGLPTDKELNFFQDYLNSVSIQVRGLRLKLIHRPTTSSIFSALNLTPIMQRSLNVINK